MEQRIVLSAANVFAHFGGVLTAGEAQDTVQLSLTAENFSIGGGHATLGFVVKPGPNSGLLPSPVSIHSLAPGNVPAISQSVLADGSSLVLAKLKHGVHDVHIAGRNDSVGAWQMHVFLAGDVNGDFVVDTTDHDLIRDVISGKITNPTFFTEADANRDGTITGFDLARASENMGVSTSVRVLTVTAGLDPLSETGVFGDNLVNQSPVNVIGLTLPGAVVSLDEDGDGFDDGTTTAVMGSDEEYFIPSYVLSADLQPGANTLRVEARDSFGQWANAQTIVILDSVAPTVVSTSPGQGAIVEEVQGQPVPVSLIFSEPMIGSTVLSSLSVVGNFSGLITPLNASYDEATQTLSFQLDASLTDTAITVQVSSSATDLAGNGLVPGGLATLNFTVERQASITEISPANGEQFVSLTRSAVVRFSEKIDPATVTGDAIQVMALGQVISGKLVVSSTERFATFIPNDPWPSSTEIRIRVDGSKIIARTGEVVDANRDGQPGGIATADFRTLPLTRIPGTDVWGYVFDSYNQNPDGSNIPIVGATIRVDSLPQANAVTDENGYFILKDMPAPDFFVHIDGTTAINAPAGTMYPSVGKPFHSVPGQSTQLIMDGTPFDIFLPPMATGDVQPLSPTETTQVGFGDAGKSQLQQMFPDLDPAVWDRMQVGFAPNAAVDKDGNAATEAVVIPVPPDRIPAPLPPNVNPQLVISIQAIGATSFDVPAPVTFPNLEGLAPGEKSLIFSFNHDAGRWDVIGTGTVSADGLTIASDPGVGVLAPGWHFVISGTRARFQIGERQSDEGCGGGDDYESGDFPIGPVLLNPMVSSRLLTPTPLLELEFRAYLVLLQTDFLGQEMVTRFMAGTQEMFTHDVGTELSTLAANTATFQGVHTTVEQSISQQIQGQANGGSIDNMQLDVTIPQISFGFGDGLKIKSLIGGTQGADLFIEDFGASGTIISPDVGGFGTYSAKLRYEICDDFGVDGGDTYAPPLAAFWVLQHYRTGHRPFINKIVIEHDINGSFTIPPGYEEIDIRLSSQAQPLGAFTAQAVAGAGVITAGSAPVSTAPGFGANPVVYYRYVVQNGPELTGTLEPQGFAPEFVLPPNRFYTATFYQPSTNRSAVIAAVSSPSGELSLFSDAPGGAGEQGSFVNLTDFGGPDADGDGIPDVGEFAIGTDPNNPDTSGDGISDSAALEMGLNPLDGRAFPTGTISSLPLPGPAEKVTVDGNRLYVASGNGGLAIVDGTQFNNPILLGQLALPGFANSIGVDGNLGIAAVGAGSAGLHLVDVADGMAPRLIRTVASVPANKVEVANGLAYVVSGNALRIVDLVTGNLVQSLNLPGSGTTTGFAREGTKLYAFVSGSDTFSVIDIANEGAAVVRGQVNVSVASSDVGLFVGNGIAWLSGSGLRTIDVSNPNAPTIIKLPSGSEFFTARRIALNGSGLGLLLPDGGNFLQVYDTSNPNNVADLLLQLPITGNARDVAVSRGIAYIGSGNRLDVVNYLPFDNKKVPPVVSISTSAADQDLIKPGLQVLEGTTLPVRVDVSDDVQVRNVELLVNGEVVANDVSFPFDFFAIAPSVAAAGNSFTLQVRATDTGGNSALSNPLTVDLVEDTFAPTIVFIEPPTGASRVEPLQTVQVRFSKSMSASTVTAQTIRVRDTAGNYYTPVNFQLRDDDRFTQLTLTPLTLGDYEIVISGSVTDRVGNRLSEDDFVSLFSLTLRGMVQTSVVDADPSTTGIQVYEGTSVPVTVTVVSGVSVQHVELLVNGHSFGIDSTAPYTFSVIAPNIVPGADTLTLQARIRDTAGITTLTNGLTIGLLEDVTAPTITGFEPTSGGTAFEGLQVIKVNFSEPLAVGSVTTANFQLFEAGPDGILGTEDDVALDITGVQLANDDSQVQLATASLPIGFFRLILIQDGITDRAGNSLGTGAVESDFELLEQVLINSGFEEGLADWTIQQSFSGLANTVTSYTGDRFYAPKEGDRFALLQTGTVNFYTTVEQQFTAQTGDTISGWAFFDTTDYLPFNDDGFVRILSGSTVVATVFSASVGSVGDYGSTDWTSWQHTFTAGGSYTIQAGVTNRRDSGVSSYLGLDAIQVVRSSPLIATVAGAAEGASVSEFDANALADIAAQFWTTALGLPSVPAIMVQVVDLPPGHLGLASVGIIDFDSGIVSGTVLIDLDADGLGWFVDVTPLERSEFGFSIDVSAFAAESDSLAAGQYDLFTVLLHEVGHLLGFVHTEDANDVMFETLTPGVRRLPYPRALVAYEPDGNNSEVQEWFFADWPQAEAVSEGKYEQALLASWAQLQPASGRGFVLPLGLQDENEPRVFWSAANDRPRRIAHSPVVRSLSNAGSISAAGKALTPQTHAWPAFDLNADLDEIFANWGDEDNEES